MLPAEGAEDRLASWQAQWDTKRTGWHMNDVSPVLTKHLKELFPEDTPGARMLFPLCGKTVDMAFMALYDFAAEQGATGTPAPAELPQGVDTARFSGFIVLPKTPEGQEQGVAPQPVTLIQGDFLAMGKQEAQSLVPFEAAFDRGSLVAVSPSDRQPYMAALAELIAPGGRVLLEAFEHDPFHNGRLGPPFEVTEAQLRELCAGRFEVRPLSRQDALDDMPMMREMGATYFTVCVYLLQRTAPAE